MREALEILVISPGVENRRSLTTILEHEGWDTVCASRVSECYDVLTRHNVSLLFCERYLSDSTYRDVLAVTRSLNRHVRVVVTSRLVAPTGSEGYALSRSGQANGKAAVFDGAGGLEPNRSKEISRHNADKLLSS
jgi:CheY-like chemotaxis protein